MRAMFVELRGLGDAVEADAVELGADDRRRAAGLDAHDVGFTLRGDDADLLAGKFQGEAEALSGLQVRVGLEVEAARADVVHDAGAAIELDRDVAREALVPARVHDGSRSPVS